MLADIRKHLRQPLAEFIGTFFLILTIALVTEHVGDTLGPLAIGGMLMTQIFAFGHISGAHYNPAVSLAVLLAGRGNLKPFSFVLYLVAQFLGGLFGAIAGHYITDTTTFVTSGPGVSHGQAFVGEFLVTFALASVVLNVATTRAQKDNSFFGLAIGFTVMAGAVSAGPFTGGSFNPATLMLNVVHKVVGADAKYGAAWIYLIAPLLGGSVAALFFRIMNPAEYEKEEEDDEHSRFASRSYTQMDTP